MTAVGMNQIEFNTKTAEPYELQFWRNLDGIYQLSEIGMKKQLPYFVTDPSNRMKVEAILQGQENAHLDAEETQTLLH